MTDAIQASPRNEWLGTTADWLAKLKTIAETASKMGVAGQPAALLSLMIGEAPKTLDRMSYGGSVSTPPQETGPDASIAQKYGGVMDLAGMVPAGKILGVAKSLAGAVPLGAALGHMKPVKTFAEAIHEIAPEIKVPESVASHIYAPTEESFWKAHEKPNFNPDELMDPELAADLGHTNSLPAIDPSMSTMSQAPAIAHIPQDPLHAEHLKFLSDQGLSPEDIFTIQKYTRESVADISARYSEAQKNATELLGLSPTNDILRRRMESPFDKTKLNRGSNTPRAEITPPIELPSDVRARTENSVGWPHPMTFASIDNNPGWDASQYGYASQYRNQLAVRGTADRADLFDPGQLARGGNPVDEYGHLTQPLHPLEQKFIDTYEGLKKQESEGTLNLDPAYSHEKNHRAILGNPNATIFQDPEWAIKHWRLGGAGLWEKTERPDVVATLQQMGYPGFVTKESGANMALFDPRLRFENAAYDPTKFDSRNLFASLAGGGAGVSALAAMLLPQADQPQ